MKRFFINFTIIIFLNLFAFLGLGYILDSLFETKSGFFMIIMLIISIIPLFIIMYFQISKFNKQLNQINENKDE